MKRSKTGKFVTQWEGEPKKRVNLSLTQTAWNNLEEFAKRQQISKSEVIELYARCLDAQPPQLGAEEKEGFGLVNALSDCQRVEEELQRLNRDLQRRVTELQTLLDVIPIGIAVAHDAECKHITTNPYFAELLGVAADKNSSKSAPTADQLPYKILRNGEEFPASELPMQVAAAQEREVRGQECDVLCADGTLRHLFMNAAPLFDEQGRVRGCIGAFVDITKSKQVEQALRESEARFRAAAEGSFDAVYILQSVRDDDGEIIDFKFIDLNSKGSKLISLPREALINQRLCELLPINRTGGFFEKYKRVVETQEALEEEFPISAPEFVASWLHHQVVPLGDGIAIISRDISDVYDELRLRKRTEEELRRANERFELAAAAVKGVIYDWDIEQNRIERTQGLVDIVGYCSEEAEPTLQWWDDRVHPDDRPRLHQTAAAVFPSGNSFTIEYRVRHKDGQYRDVWDRALIERDASGRVVRIVGCTLDVTERKQAQEALLETNQTLEALIQACPLAITLFNLDGKVKMWNPAAETIFGWSEQEALDNFLPCIPENKRDEFLANLDVIRQGHTLRGVETCRQTKSGELIDISLWAAPVRDAKGNISCMSIVADITERKQAQERLHQSEERLRLALDASKAGVWDWDIPNNHITWSERIYEFHGLAPGTFGGKVEDYAMLIHPEEQERVSRAIQKAIEEKTNYQIEFRIVQPSGAVRWISTQGRVIYDATGKPVRMLGATIDTTERKGAESEREQLLVRERTARSQVEAAQRQLATIFETSPVGIGFLDRQQRFVAINEALAEINGLSREQHLDHTIPELFGESEPKLVELFHGIYTTGAPFISPKLAVNVPGRDDRRPGYYSVYYLPTTNSDSQVESVLVYVIDVTEQVRLEERDRFLACCSTVLASSLDYQTTLERVAHLAVPKLADWCVVDILEEDGSLSRLATAHVDPAKVEWAHELQRRYPTDLNAPQGIANVLRTGQPEYYPEILDSQLVASARDAEHLKILRELGFSSVMIVPLLARGRTLGTISFLGRHYDSNDLSLAEELACRAALAVDNATLYGVAQRDRASAEAANRMKDEFLATLSHELRTPLNAMLGWTQMLRTRKLSEATAAKALETVDRNTRSLSRLIEDILDVSRIITGKLRLNLLPVELSEVIEAAIDAVRPATDAKEIQIACFLDPLPRPVSGDPDRLQQVVWNLLSNAVKFTPKKGYVEVRLERIDSHIQIQVTDTGQGIDPNFLPYVFERFRQADSSATRSVGGLGLGMAIVRHLVELHGGTVKAESPGIGQGATFTVKLPILALYSPDVCLNNDSEPMPPTAEKGLSLDNPSVLNGLRVLVVDDEADARELCTTVLEQYGAEVIAVATASEALDVIKQSQPDVLVSDIGMPHEDGYSLIARVRALKAEQGGQIPAVALTAYARESDRTKVLLAGFQQHLPKPVRPAELAAVVATLTGRTGQGSELVFNLTVGVWERQ